MLSLLNAILVFLLVLIIIAPETISARCIRASIMLGLFTIVYLLRM